MYYIFDYSTDPKIIGSDYPQSYNFIKGYDPNTEHALYELYKYKVEFPPFTPRLDGLRLSGRAKLTDFISNSFGGMIMSNEAKTVLEKYNLCPHRFYPFKFYARNKEYNYFYMQIISNYAKFVNYKKSTFVEYYSYSRRGKSVEINSQQDLLEQKKIIKELNLGKNVTIWGDKIVMNKDFDKSLDFFEISILDGNLYTSEELMNDILSNELTGCDFKPAKDLTIP